MNKPVYLDYNGTTPHDPEVIEAMRPYLETEFGNPSSSHSYGSKPRKAVLTARGQVAGLLNCRPEEVLFTSGGTESNNHAIQGVVKRFGDRGNHIITSAAQDGFNGNQRVTSSKSTSASAATDGDCEGC